MKFLAIDTSDRAFVVAAKNGCREEARVVEGVHSVLLMDEIDEVLRSVGLTAAEVDYFACVVGPGSFTGIRIGISTVKGLCFALNKNAVALTSFDVLAYAETGAALALVDAGHGHFYTCPYSDGKAGEPAFLSREELIAYSETHKFLSSALLSVPTEIKDRAQGLIGAAELHEKAACGGANLKALYLRKSSAEEKR